MKINQLNSNLGVRSTKNIVMQNNNNNSNVINATNIIHTSNQPPPPGLDRNVLRELQAVGSKQLAIMEKDANKKKRTKVNLVIL